MLLQRQSRQCTEASITVVSLPWTIRVAVPALLGDIVTQISDFDCIVLRDIAARDYLGRNAAIRLDTLRAVGVQGKTKQGE
jgi:hypothetical protein